MKLPGVSLIFNCDQAISQIHSADGENERRVTAIYWTISCISFWYLSAYRTVFRGPFVHLFVRLRICRDESWPAAFNSTKAKTMKMHLYGVLFLPRRCFVTSLKTKGRRFRAKFPMCALSSCFLYYDFRFYWPFLLTFNKIYKILFAITCVLKFSPIWSLC